MSSSDSSMLYKLPKWAQKKCVVGIFKYNLVPLSNFTPIYQVYQMDAV